MKLILEKEDIEEYIREKHGHEVIIDGIPDDLSITVKGKDFTVGKPTPPSPQPQPKREIVRETNGSINAEKSGLALKNREKTIPGSAMGRTRGNLPVF